MKKVTFDEKELKVVGSLPHFLGGDPVDFFDSPIPRSTNYANTMKNKESMWVPTFFDKTFFQPRCIPDNIARASVADGGDAVPFYEDGYKDMFGVEWLYVPVAGGSMPRPGVVYMDDVNDWKEKAPIPDPDKFDWEGQVEISRDYLEGKDNVEMTILTGYFERLISLMEFENAAIAMIDEDQEDAIKEFFDALTDFYCRYIDKALEYFPMIAGIEIHDDWGSQRAPFFMLDTVRTMLVPYMKRLTDHIHSKGLFAELHSCGKNEIIVPAIIEAGFDTWTPQAMNDFSFLYKEYGNKLILGMCTPDLPLDCTDEEAAEAAATWVDEFVQPGMPVTISPYAKSNGKVFKELYRQSRIKLAK